MLSATQKWCNFEIQNVAFLNMHCKLKFNTKTKLKSENKTFGIPTVDWNIKVKAKTNNFWYQNNTITHKHIHTHMHTSLTYIHDTYIHTGLGIKKSALW